MKLSKPEIMQQLSKSGVVPVIRGVQPDKVELLADHLAKGGITALEITVDSPNAFELIGKLSDLLRGRALVGAGTVLDSEAAYEAIQSGAEFLISPSLHREVIDSASRYGKVSIPGVMTPTEMMQAVQWGADCVKIFPARNLGADFVKDVKAPLPHIQIIPTGGVNLENIAEFIKAGASAVGVGSHLVDHSLLQANDYKQIQNLAAKYVEAVQKARS